MVRSLFYLFVFLCLTISTQAQGIDYSPDPVLISGGHLTEDIKDYFTVTNTTTENIYLNWEIEVVGEPAEWDFQLCDLWLCYDFDIERNDPARPNEMLPGVDTSWIWHTAPRGKEGVGDYLVHLRDANTGETLATVPIQVTAILSDTEELQISDPVIYPNPAKSVFQINHDSDVSKVNIHNIVGKLVSSYQHKAGNIYDVEHLAKGLYLVRLFGDNGSTIKVLRLNIR